MVLSLSLVERSQGWASLILKDYHFIHPGSMYTVYLLPPAFKSKSPSQYVITLPVTYNYNLFASCAVTLSCPCSWFLFPPLWIPLGLIRISHVFVSVLPLDSITPTLGKQYRNMCLWPVEQIWYFQTSGFPRILHVHTAHYRVDGCMEF